MVKSVATSLQAQWIGQFYIMHCQATQAQEPFKLLTSMICVLPFCWILFWVWDNLLIPHLPEFYSIASGIQGPEHPNPGRPYYAVGFPRVCYIPDTDKGRKVSILIIFCLAFALFHQLLQLSHLIIVINSGTSAASYSIWAAFGFHSRKICYNWSRRCCHMEWDSSQNRTRYQS